MTRMCARLELRTGRLAHTHVVSRKGLSDVARSSAFDANPHDLKSWEGARGVQRKGARSASEMQSCWLDKSLRVRAAQNSDAGRSPRSINSHRVMQA